MEKSEKVVGQDKGSGSPSPGPADWSPTANDFFADYPDRTDRFRSGWEWIGVIRQAQDLRAVAYVIALMALLITFAWFFQLRIMWTDSSAPAGIYRLITAPVARGELVLACLPDDVARNGLMRGYLRRGDCPAAAEPVAKLLLGFPGDLLELRPGWVAVNGVKFPNSQTAVRDSAGRPLAHVPSGAQRVGAGEVWLFGFNNVRSWDARYFGPVPLANVRGVLRPLVTW